jgi:hypothetical protein
LLDGTREDTSGSLAEIANTPDMSQKVSVCKSCHRGKGQCQAERTAGERISQYSTCFHHENGLGSQSSSSTHIHGHCLDSPAAMS